MFTDQEQDSLGLASMGEDVEQAEYRSVSVAAIVSLGLGLASSLALAHPVCWVLPLITVAVSWLTLRKIAGDQRAVAGRGLAACGLVLALFFGGWAVTRTGVTRFVLHRHARKAADTWIEMIQQGDLQRAHQWTQTAFSRISPQGNLSAAYEGVEAAQQLEDFQKSPLVKQLVGSKSEDIQFLEVDQSATPREHFWNFQYRLKAVDSNQPPRDCHVLVRRYVYIDEKVVEWRVGSFGFLEL